MLSDGTVFGREAELATRYGRMYDGTVMLETPLWPGHPMLDLRWKETTFQISVEDPSFTAMTQRCYRSDSTSASPCLDGIGHILRGIVIACILIASLESALMLWYP